MPKIYEYLGIVIFFNTNDHEPIHCHATYGELESKAEIYISDGKITEIKIKKVADKRPLKGSELKEFKKLVEKYADAIVEKWVDLFVWRKKITCERITKKL